MEKPQIICHIEKSLPFTLYDALWIPSSAKFVVLGSQPRGSGVFQIYEINESEACVVKNVEKNTAFKCGTFGASSLRQRNLATGDFEGRLQIWGLEDLSTPIYSVNAHKQIINCIDGAGGLSIGCGAPEIVTGSRDGKALENHGIKVTNVTGQKLKETANIVEKEFLRSVKVWDPRQKNKPVAVMEPVEGETRRDCWSVAFGNSYNTEERVVCAGYDNGDIKMFDLKTMSLRWETNVKNGVCCVEFDRKDIKMNKLIATSLESKFHVYDLKTYHPKKGFAKFSEKAHKSTIWVGRSLPQNREIFATCGGGGTLCIWKYNYPEKRERETSEGEKVGVAGTVSLLQNSVLSSQPLSSFQWSPDKTGLAVCTSFDQICIGTMKPDFKFIGKIPRWSSSLKKILN